MIDEGLMQQVIDLHAVYRMYSASDRLLYIGMTNDLGRRLDEHTGKRWFPQIATITLEWFPDKSTAQAAEKRAIRTEHPAYNIIHAPVPIPVPLKSPTIGALLESEKLTLAEAVMAGLLPTLGAARKASGRPGFPPSVGLRGMAKLYAVDDLKAYQARKRRRAS